jgi:hypothetical protein
MTRVELALSTLAAGTPSPLVVAARPPGRLAEVCHEALLDVL